MIIVFGSIYMDLRFVVEELPEKNENVFARQYIMTPGGKGANQALSALRSSSRVALVGAVGDDEFGKDILEGLSKEGIMTSGVAAADRPTGTIAHFTDEHGASQNVTAPGANLEASAGQIPEDILDEKSLVLLQTEIKPEENAALLAKAKDRGATTMMNLAPSIELSRKALNNLDYLVVNQEEARQLAEKLGLKVESDAMRLAHGLSEQGGVNCIVTIGAQGSVAVTKEGIGWSIGALPVEAIIDRSGAEDAYCGALAACINADLPLPRAMKRASIAGSLACTVRGGQNAIPTLDEIESRLDDLEDPKKETLDQLLDEQGR